MSRLAVWAPAAACWDRATRPTAGHPLGVPRLLRVGKGERQHEHRAAHGCRCDERQSAASPPGPGAESNEAQPEADEDPWHRRQRQAEEWQRIDRFELRMQRLELRRNGRDEGDEGRQAANAGGDRRELPCDVGVEGRRAHVQFARELR